MTDLFDRAIAHTRDLSPDMQGEAARVLLLFAGKKEVSYQPSKMLTHIRRVTPHEWRRAFALASGQYF